MRCPLTAQRRKIMTASKPQDVIVHDKIYINGEWVKPSGEGSIEVTNSTTEEVMGRIPEGNAEDVNTAVGAARAAFDAWSTTPATERAAILGRIAEGLKNKQGELANLIANEVCMP